MLHNVVVVARRMARLQRQLQQICAQACALVATGWPNERNSVAVRRIQMLRSFGRNLQMLGQQRRDVLR